MTSGPAQYATTDRRRSPFADPVCVVGYKYKPPGKLIEVRTVSAYEVLADAPPQNQPEHYLSNYIVVPDMFTPAECRRIVYANLPVSQAHVTRFEEGSFNDLQMNSRNTKVKSVPQIEEFAWLYKPVVEKIRTINQTCFHFKIKSLTNLQILEYENTGFYGTHIDVGTGETSRRKFSMVVFLTPEEEYQGGELILKPWFTPVVQKQGSAVFFPSYIPHEIRPVTQGVRHTMVTWVLGPAFR